MPWNVHDWLQRRPNGLDVYAVLGRRSFDTDRTELLQTVKDANRQLHPYQNHHDQGLYELAQAWQRAVAAAAATLHDRHLLTAQHAELLDKLRASAEAEFGPLANVSPAKLRRWLVEENGVNDAQLGLIVKALTKGKQAECLAALEKEFFPAPNGQFSTTSAPDLNVVGQAAGKSKKAKNHRGKELAQQPVELVEVDEDTWRDPFTKSNSPPVATGFSDPSKWYCKLAEEWVGPYGADELDYLRVRGQINAETQMRRAGQVESSSARELLPEWFPRPIEKAPVVSAIPVAVAEIVAEAVTSPTAQPAQPSPVPTRSPVHRRQHACEAGESIAQRRSKQVLLGAGIGMLTATLIFLLLLALLSFGGGGGGLAGGGGRGGGVGSGDGSGKGPGKGSGSGGGVGSGKGTGQGSGTSPGNKPPAPSDLAQNTPNPNAGPTDPDSPVAIEPPSENRAFQLLDAKPVVRNTPAPAAKNEGEDYGRSGGGGGGSDGSEFFGTRASGSKFVYIVDCSSSMVGPKFAKAKEELVASLRRLKPTQSAYVFFFSTGSYPMFSPNGSVEAKLLPCNKANLQKMEAWINSFAAVGGTEPRQALLEALDLKPNAIFFLTDGGFDPTVADDVRQKNQQKVSINTICFVDAYGEPVMKQIASENRGDYRFVP